EPGVCRPKVGSTPRTARSRDAAQTHPTRPWRRSAPPTSRVDEHPLAERQSLRPLPVLLVQKHDETREPPREHRQPRRGCGVQQISLGQVLSYFRQYIKQKACRHATQNHSRDAAKAEEP